MNSRAKVILHLAGHDFHPVYDQAERISNWLGDWCWCHWAESLAAFEHLGECDLLVFLGMYYSGWEGRYRAPGGTHGRAFERYVASGKPMIFCHGAIASYDDWPRFSQLAGFSWRGHRPTFALTGEYTVRIERHDDDPITQGVEDHVLIDAPPLDVRTASDMDVRVHASIYSSERAMPMWMTGRGGRIEGAGKTAFIGAGHDLRAFSNDATRQMWLNTVRWCMARD